jgi:hypothetical protein
MTTGRGPTDNARMDDPLLQIPFQVILFGAVALTIVFVAWSLLGVREAYRSIGSGGLSLDVPYRTGDDPVDGSGVAD